MEYPVISPLYDAFGRQRVSSPNTIWESSFLYDLQPLLYEPITTGSGTVAHSATNSCATLSTGGTGAAALQSYRYIRYQPGKSQLIKVTFNMGTTKAGTTKQIWYGDTANGFCFEVTSTGCRFKRVSSSDEPDLTVEQADWNVNTFMAGPMMLDTTKNQILVIDAQWLGVGRVRVGWAMSGTVFWAHTFNHANASDYVYVKQFTLPIRANITGTQTDSMAFICSSVESEGGVENEPGFTFTVEGTATAGSGTRTHILSIQPKTTFNSIANRSLIILESIDLVITGTNPIEWELTYGNVLTGTTTFTDVNTTYSGVQFNTLGTTGTPAIVAASGYVVASGAVKSSVSAILNQRYPITLDAAGAVRALGRASLCVTGIGGTSACRATMTWREVR